MSLLLPPDREERTIFIIGQGLAGSVLAFLLLKRGYNVKVLDDDHSSSSSIVAAGMWNPLSFRNLHESWKAHLLIPAAHQIYTEMETDLGISFYHPLDLVRLFPDERSANEWDERSLHPEISEYISPNEDPVAVKDFIQPFGHGVIKGAGWLNLPEMLSAMAAKLSDEGRLQKISVDATLQKKMISEGHVVVQCSGWKLISGSGLDWLPVRPNKGEVLTVSIPDMKSSAMFNFGKFIVPVGNAKFRLGATYQLEPLNADPTLEAREELVEDLKKACLHPFEVTQHMAGYRPTVPDRKPLLGFHPEMPSLGICNGFGSKGVMLAPFLISHLIDHMTTGIPIMHEVNFMRYHSRFGA